MKVWAVAEKRDHIDSESVGRDVGEKDAFLFVDESAEHRGFGGCAEGDGEVWMNICAWFFSKDMRDKFLNCGDVRRSANEQDTIHRFCRDLSDA